MRLILSSCDFGNPVSAREICDNLGKPIADCRVLYFPNERYTEEKIKNGVYTSRLEKFGFSRANIHVAEYRNPEPYLNSDIDAVYISGGNTFATLKLIRDAGFDKAISEYVHKGAVYIGGSAGAHIACVDIFHVTRYDENSVGLTDFKGLCLYPGILICHYSPERRADFERLSAHGRYPVRVLSDKDVIVVETDK